MKTAQEAPLDIRMDSTIEQDSTPEETYIARTMPQTLGSLDMTAIYLMVIFFIGNAGPTASGGVVSLTYLLLGALTFFIPCVVANAQLGVLLPREGSIYTWTMRAMGPRWGFFAGVSYWLPSVLAIIGAADGFVTYIQGLHPTWLTQPWQQGLVIVALILFTYLLSTQRLRTTQNVVNVVIFLVLVVVGCVAFGGLVFFLAHGSRTPLNHLSDWSVNRQNFPLFGLIAFLYLGISVPMNMGGEMKEGNKRRIVTSHLLWGTIVVVVAYFVCILALLIVRGPDLAQSSNLFYEIVVLIRTTCGPAVAFIATMFILSFYLLSPVVYNYATARLLFKASVDRQIPAFFGRLNAHRAPANALLFQSLLAIAFVGLIFFIAPLLTIFNKPTNLATEFYNVVLATMTLIWALSTLFYFLDLFMLHRRERHMFLRHRIFPMWLLWVCGIVGTVTCLVVAFDTFANSWTPLISNTAWAELIGGLMLVSVLGAALMSMFASSQASWEHFEQDAQE